MSTSSRYVESATGPALSTAAHTGEGRGRAAPLARLIAPFLRLPLPVRVAAFLVAIVAAGAAVLSWDAGRWAAGEIGGATVGVSTFANGAHSPDGGPVIAGAITLHRVGSAVPAVFLAATLHVLAIIARATMRAEGASPRSAHRRAEREAGARPMRAPAARAQEAPKVLLPDGRRVSAGHARKLRAKQRAAVAA